jgi:Cd2+/Zn2+-exporting ATPase
MRDGATATTDGELDGGFDVGLREWRVMGMDCAACASKIRGAVAGLPGVSDVDVSVLAGTLRLTLDGGDPSAVEARVRRLGYGVAPKTGPGAAGANADDAGHHDHGAAGGVEGPWNATAKGRLVLATGGLLAAAWGLGWLTGGALGAWPFIAACLLGAAPIARRAVAAARAGQPFTIEMLMTIAAAGALVIGAAEEAALVVFLFAVGELLEGVAAARARDGVRALAALQPKTAQLEEGGAVREVPAASLRVGQIALVRPGDRVPADGVVVAGVSGIDQSPVTGESVPVAKGPGDEVFAGSINTEAALRVRVSRPAADNTIARIIRLVEEAESARAPTERFIDRFSRVYMPAIVALSALVMIVPPLAVGADWGTWVYRGLALLLIGCPCALVISVPASIASALSAGARRGILIKGGAVIEAAAATTRVAFDKTGTLTCGRPEVTDVIALGATAADALGLAAAVEAGSSHPLATAIRARATAESAAPRFATAARAIPGRGVAATIAGAEVFVGSPRLAVENDALDADAHHAIAALEADGKTVAVVFRARTGMGLIALRDEPRADAADAVRQLGAMGIDAIMLTGDNAPTAAAVAEALGVAHRAELLPGDKVAAIREIAAGQRLMMVGDGINDAPALAAAHVGVAMGGGTDVALETAQAALLRDRVGDVAGLIRLSRAAMANIRQNVAIALGLKAVFLVTTVFGITGLWIAILADTGATVLVTMNALRLLRFDPERES